ncbi:MAG: Nif3-like dinuclear metal center hexameric protein [Deltaproteobacteria bacterium]|nr:Nif3-like dinuclear metal center hexameric protein [Deltaproteobacteria bacterium]
MARVLDIIELMENVAPAALAEDWDNPGLQVGWPDAEVRHVFVALDPSLAVVSAACAAGADMLICHHPLIFSSIKKFDFTTPAGRIIEKAVLSGLSIFAAHTNLDSVSGGLNDLLAGIIGVFKTRPLMPGQSEQEYKLVFFVPESHTDIMISELTALPTGIIGNYRGCFFSVAGTGRFIPHEGAHPYSGHVGEASQVPEFRVETRVCGRHLKEVMDKIQDIHPYETVAIDVYPVLSGKTRHGIGRVGRLPAPIDLAGLARKIKTSLRLKSVRVSGPQDLNVSHVALCTGSGSSLLKSFFSSNAQVFISGDLKYHDAMDVMARGRALIDVGHFASEHIIVSELKKRLEHEAVESRLDVRFTAWDGEADPFYSL